MRLRASEWSRVEINIGVGAGTGIQTTLVLTELRVPLVRAFGRLMVGQGMVDRGVVVHRRVKTVRPERHLGYVSNSGVAHLCRVHRWEWARSGVRVNAVGSGYTENLRT